MKAAFWLGVYRPLNWLAIIFDRLADWAYGHWYSLQNESEQV